MHRDDKVIHPDTVVLKARPVRARQTRVAPRRRDFLAGMAGGLLCRGAPFFAASLSGAAVLVALSAEWRCAAVIGRACLAALPEAERSRDALVQNVLRDIRAAGGDCRSVRALAQAVRGQSRTDFGVGRIVVVDGWVLSRTETRVYALTALLA